MNIKSVFAVFYAKILIKRIKKWVNNPHNTQQKVFKHLILKGKKTAFGIDNDFKNITNYNDFKERVKIKDYEGLKPYIDRVVKGESDVLWQGKPLYLAKTSGTTSGIKYIPITKESMPTHINAAKSALLFYIVEKNDANFVDGKMMFLQGSPILKDVNGIKVGRLSGIAAHYVPKYLLKNRLPSWETNCIEDWETKVNAIVEETIVEDMRVISGIPSWVQMYFEKLIVRAKKPVSEIFTNFNLFIHGGVNFDSYKNKFESLIKKKIDYIELYPASEGFIAFQDSQKEKGMLLQLNSGMFYEFIPADEFYSENPTRISLKDVKIGVNYVIILSTTAGLWGYNIGDTIEFTSKNPYKIIVTGRIKHFISAFGEHVIGSEVKKSLSEAVFGTNISISEFTVAPQVNPKNGLPYHEWFIEFEKTPKDLENFANKIDASMQSQNIYYFDLIKGKILRPLIIRKVIKGGFYKYMESIGKLGGQNKIPQLANDRKIAEGLKNYLEL